MRLSVHHSFITIFVGLSLTSSALAQTTRPRTLTAREIAQRAFPSVVLLVTEDEKGKAISLGSGFFVRNDVVATNYHVLKDASRILARVVGSKTVYEVGVILSTNEETDLALLRIKNARARTLPLGNSNSVRVGDTIYVIGNPKGLEGTFSQGIVSGIRQLEGQRIIQITAPISTGSSGGPVLDNRGEVIGIATAVLEEGQNLNFAVPVSSLTALLKVYAAPTVAKGGRISNRSTRRLQQRQPVNTDEWEEISPEEFFNEQEILNWKKEVIAHPDSAEAHYKLGNAYSLQKQYTQAIQEYKQAIRLWPISVEAHLGLGWVYGSLDRYDEALDEFKQVNANYGESGSADAYYAMGWIYNAKGNYGEAIQAYKKSLSLAPDFVEAHYNLGLIYLGFEDKGAALNEYKILKALNKDFANKLFNEIYK
jgi:cytochrome c-type biogenesis protein CcmH/NrfG